MFEWFDCVQMLELELTVGPLTIFSSLQTALLSGMVHTRMLQLKLKYKSKE